MNNHKHVEFEKNVYLFGAHGFMSEIRGTEHWFIVRQIGQTGGHIPKENYIKTLRRRLREPLQGLSLVGMSTFTVDRQTGIALYFGDYISHLDTGDNDTQINFENVVLPDIFGEKKWNIIISSKCTGVTVS